MSRTEDLLQRWVDGDLDATELAEWEDLLRRDPLLAERLWQVWRTDRELTVLFGPTGSLCGSVMDSLRARRGRFVAGVLRSARHRRIPRQRRRTRRRLVGAALLIAVLLLAGVGWWAATADRGGVLGEVILVNGGVAVIEGQERPLHRGQPLTVGLDIRLDRRERVLLRYRDGSQAEVVGPAALRCEGSQGRSPAAGHLLLQRGWLRCSVAPQQTGLTIATPQAFFTVLGTRFDLIADRSQTRLVVQEGRVRVHTPQGDRSTVAAGSWALVDADEVAVSSEPGLWFAGGTLRTAQGDPLVGIELGWLASDDADTLTATLRGLQERSCNAVRVFVFEPALRDDWDKDIAKADRTIAAIRAAGLHVVLRLRASERQQVWEGEEVAILWQRLARRYADDPAIAFELDAGAADLATPAEILELGRRVRAVAPLVPLLLTTIRDPSAADQTNRILAGLDSSFDQVGVALEGDAVTSPDLVSSGAVPVVCMGVAMEPGAVRGLWNASLAAFVWWTDPVSDRKPPHPDFWQRFDASWSP